MSIQKYAIGEKVEVKGQVLTVEAWNPTKKMYRFDEHGPCYPEDEVRPYNCRAKVVTVKSRGESCI